MKAIDERLLRVEPGRRVRLDEFDSAATHGFDSKEAAAQKMSGDLEKLDMLQALLAASARHAVLVILQGPDAAGKDGVVKHVMSGLNPLNLTVTSFKQPSEEERLHDYLWRCSKALPARGHIGIFNRSYYEEVGVVRVHPDVAAAEGLVKPGKRVWKERFEDIASFERYLTRNGTIVLKFYLHLSKDEQRKRLLARIGDPRKQWKIDAADIRERTAWDAYRAATCDFLTHTNTECAPWYVVPADRKWFARLAVAEVLVHRLGKLGLTYPTVTSERKAFLDGAREMLTSG